MSETPTIKASNRWYDLIAWCELPWKEREFFDYVEENDKLNPRFVKYRGEWYDTCEFEAANWHDEHPQRAFMWGWHGFQTDSYFSGVLCRFDSSCERVQMGRFYS